jgi:YD repeat-containing protein
VVDANHTRVTLQPSAINPGQAPTYTHVVGFDGNMNVTSDTDGTATTPIFAATYADPNTPYRPSTVVDGNGLAANNGVTGVWKLYWDPYDNLLTGTTPRGVTTTYTYSYATYSTGLLTKVQEGTKSPITLSYTTRGELQSVSAPRPGTVGGSQTVTSSFTYSTLGNLLTMTTPGNPSTVVNGVDQGITISYNYTSDGGYGQAEALGQPIRILRSEPNATPVSLRYDAQGNLLTTTAWAQSLSFGFPIQASYGYNLANQLDSATLPPPNTGALPGSTVLIDYAFVGGPTVNVSQVDSNGNTLNQISYSYDSENRPVQVSGSTETLLFSYDAANRITNLTDGRGHATYYTYTTAGYLSQIFYPGETNTTAGHPDTVSFLSYDADGNLLQRLDGRGILTQFSYNDPESLLTGLSYPAAFAATNNAGLSRPSKNWFCVTLGDGRPLLEPAR